LGGAAVESNESPQRKGCWKSCKEYRGLRKTIEKRPKQIKLWELKDGKKSASSQSIPKVVHVKDGHVQKESTRRGGESLCV